MAVVYVLRIVVLSIALILAIILLGLSASLFNVDIHNYTKNTIFAYRPLFEIACSAGNILAILTLLIVDLVRRGAFAPAIVVELSCLVGLSTLWVVVAVYTKGTFESIYSGSCALTEWYFEKRSITTCHIISAISPVALTIAALLLAYTTFLLICCLIASRCGRKVWLSSVRLASFFGPEREGWRNPGSALNRHTIPAGFALTLPPQSEQYHLSTVNSDQCVAQPAPPYFPRDWEV